MMYTSSMENKDTVLPLVGEVMAKSRELGKEIVMVTRFGDFSPYDTKFIILDFFKWLGLTPQCNLVTQNEELGTIYVVDKVMEVFIPADYEVSEIYVRALN